MARRHFNPRPDILEDLSDFEILQRYRMNKNGILFLNKELSDVIEPNTKRNHSLSAIHKILITLRYLATGSIQLNYADVHGVSQPTVSRVITQVVDAIFASDLRKRFIKFPTSMEEIKIVKREFYEVANFPNVIGVIDGTHIQIQAPSREEESYINRMGYHSINTQIVFDANYRIIDLVARWPGATHDSRMLRESGLYNFLDGNSLPGNNYLLGDSGYPCKRWLLTPYLAPQPGAQLMYNRAHKKTRTLVERGIGILKRRWGVLHGEVRLNPIQVCKVITVCGILHNVCRSMNIRLLDEVPATTTDQGDQAFHGPQEGLRYRDAIANQYF